MEVIRNFEKYQIDLYGNIYRYGRLRKWVINEDGYATIHLCQNNIIKKHKIHRLVAQTFIPNPFNLPVVNHKDGCKLNNHVSNLEWLSYKDSMKHAYDNNLINLRKPVLQLDDNGEIIKEFISITEAGKLLDIKVSNISSVLNNRRKTAGGFHWRYKVEN